MAAENSRGGIRIEARACSSGCGVESRAPSRSPEPGESMDARFALLLGCFVLSGFAALLYQTVWARELSFVFGTSELAISAVLAAYMGGLALGSSIAARIAHRLR